jgi:hypothetical protein
MRVRENLKEIRDLANEILDKYGELDSMEVSWNNQDIDSGLNDPGLQYELVCEVDNKVHRLNELIETIYL